LVKFADSKSEGTLGRIFARGGTAIWDAIHMAATDRHDKDVPTLFICLTDGQDNSSRHSYDEARAEVKQLTNSRLVIVHVGESEDLQYATISDNRYKLIQEQEITTTVTTAYDTFYPRQPSLQDLKDSDLSSTSLQDPATLKPER
jgi:hypothetical protein